MPGTRSLEGMGEPGTIIVHPSVETPMNQERIEMARNPLFPDLKAKYNPPRKPGN
jgi:hypothetical protein